MRHRLPRGTSEGRVSHIMSPGAPASHHVPCMPDHCFGTTSIQRPSDSYSTAQESNRKLLVPLLVTPSNAYSPFGNLSRNSSGTLAGDTGVSDPARKATDSECGRAVRLVIPNRALTAPATVRTITSKRVTLVFMPNDPAQAGRTSDARLPTERRYRACLHPDGPAVHRISCNEDEDMTVSRPLRSMACSL